MAAYYSENDPFAAAWLRELIKAGLIADGEVDERSIADVAADDVRGFTQCHFFAGIGGWSYALRLAGWPDDREVWTGSCPCQPFSSAGKAAGTDDSRDLWPTWFELLDECRPVVVFGEQVASADGLGWLDRLYVDLEGAGYAVGASDLSAAGVGAFHIRQRLWFVADSNGRNTEHGGIQRGRKHGLRAEDRRADGHARDIERPEDGMADTEHAKRWAVARSVEDERDGEDAGRSEAHRELGACGEIRSLADATRRDQRRHSGESRGATDARSGEARPADGHAVRSAGELGDTDNTRPQGRRLSAERAGELVARSSGVGSVAVSDERRCEVTNLSIRPAGQDETAALERGANFWSAVDWIPCADGKARPVEPGTFPLAHGVSARVGRLRGYGNAIVPQVAQVFIEAYLDCREAVEA